MFDGPVRKAAAIASHAALVVALLGSVAIARAADGPDYAALYAELGPAVVTVRTLETGVSPRRVGPIGGVGSGFFIEPNLVVTAAHVVDGVDLVQVRTDTGRVHRAEVLSIVESGDVALLRIEGRDADAPVVRVGDFDAVSVGEPLFVIGAPFGLERTLSVGYLSGRTRRPLASGAAPVELLQIDAAINPGNSGGPVFDRRGEVVGVVSFIVSRGGGFDGVGFATSIAAARDALMNGSGLRAGFEGVALSAELAALLNVPGVGILVQRVAKGSAAAASGLRAGRVKATIGGRTLRLGGDVVLGIDELVCVEPHDIVALGEAVRAMRPERSHALRVFRRGEVLTLVLDAAEPLLGLR